MAQYRGSLTSQERARIIEIQDMLIDRFVERKEAIAGKEWTRAKELETKIDDLLREKEEEIEKWAPVGSA